MERCPPDPRPLSNYSEMSVCLEAIHSTHFPLTLLQFQVFPLRFQKYCLFIQHLDSSEGGRHQSIHMEFLPHLNICQEKNRFNYKCAAELVPSHCECIFKCTDQSTTKEKCNTLPKIYSADVMLHSSVDFPRASLQGHRLHLNGFLSLKQW